MSNTDDMLASWKGMQQQAEAGELYMDEDLAEALHKRCQTLIEHLKHRKESARQLTRLSGFGDLQSARGLQSKLEGMGRDLLDRIDQHVEIVTAMDHTFQANCKNTKQQDQATADNLSGIHPGGK